MTDVSDKDPEMGALLSSLHGSISSRHMNPGRVKVRAVSLSAETCVKKRASKHQASDEGAEAIATLLPARTWVLSDP